MLSTFYAKLFADSVKARVHLNNLNYYFDNLTASAELIIIIMNLLVLLDLFYFLENFNYNFTVMKSTNRRYITVINKHYKQI